MIIRTTQNLPKFILVDNRIKHRLKKSLNFSNSKRKFKCIVFYCFQKVLQRQILYFLLLLKPLTA